MKTKIIISIILISAIIPILTLGQGALDLPKPGLTPSSPFYFLDTFFEKISLTFTFNAEKKIQKAIRYSEEKLAEVKIMIEENKTEKLEKATYRYQEALSIVNQKFQEAEDEKGNTGEILELMFETEAKHQIVLKKFLEETSEQIQSIIQSVIETSKDNQDQILESISEEKKIEFVDKINQLEIKVETEQEIKEAELKVEEVNEETKKAKNELEIRKEGILEPETEPEPESEPELDICIYESDESITNENCDDGKDNDCDGEVDGDDNKCVVPISSSQILISPLSGYVTQNSKLTLENSPYMVTEDLIIAPETKLVIEHGVEIRFNDNIKLWVQGSLYAIGTKTDDITFTQSGANNWHSIYIDNYGYAALEYVIIQYAKVGLSVVAHNNRQDYGYITHSIIRNNNTGISCGANGIFNITFNTVTLNGVGIRGAFYSDVLYNNVSFNTDDGIQGSGLIQYNTVSENGGHGINTGGNSHQGINYNNVTSNAKGGIKEQNSYEVSTTYNNIYNNSGYAYEYLRNGQVGIVTNNWWGTTDESTINSLIYDFYDDPSKGIVIYSPFATSEISDAGAQ